MDDNFYKTVNKSLKDILKKRNKIQNQNLSRYFKYHKGRTIVILLVIIVLIICVIINIPINGDIDYTNGLSKFLSFIGYISANIFVVVLITILSVETLMSREELKELDNTIEYKLSTYNKDILKDIVSKKKINSTCLLNKLQLIKKKYKVNISGSNDNEIEQLSNEINDILKDPTIDLDLKLDILIDLDIDKEKNND